MSFLENSSTFEINQELLMKLCGESTEPQPEEGEWECKLKIIILIQMSVKYLYSLRIYLVKKLALSYQYGVLDKLLSYMKDNYKSIT